MRKLLLLTSALVLPGLSGGAAAQTIGNGSIDGLKYETMTSPDGCSAASPCQIVTYLHYLGGEGPTPSDLQKYFNNSAFWAANPHTIILAPMVNGSSDTNNWGGVQEGMTSNMKAAIDLVKQIETSVPTNPNTVVVTGGSMGGIGTEAAMVEAGPKGTVDPGVFAAGLSYDGALYNSDAQAATTALCGVPYTMVHGATDTTVPHSFDDNLAGKLSSCAGFKYISVPGIGHGTWNYGPAGGYEAGTLIDETMAAARQAAPTAATAPTAPAPATPTTPTTAPTTAPAAAPVSSTPIPQNSLAVASGDKLAQQELTLASTLLAKPNPNTPLVQMLLDDAITQIATPQAGTTACASGSTTITPGQGSLTDGSGNVWTINSHTKILENGVPVVGGGDTSEMTMQGCTVMGHSNGANGSSTNWFTMNSANPTATDGWTASAPPTGVAAAPTATATPAAQGPTTTAATPVPPADLPATTPAGLAANFSCGAATPNADPAHGGFAAIDGQILAPDGTPFIARGINIREDQLNAAVSSGQLESDFPGLNMVRLYFEGSFSDNLSSIQGSINALTAKGIVVEIEDHTGISKPPYTGSQLAAEQAWYSTIASANKTNPYVWFGTFNEPGNGTDLPGIAAQEIATYNTIRAAGNNNPVMMEEPSGGNPGLVGASGHGYDGSGPMTPSAFASMENIIWDLHYYGWVSKYSTDQATVDAALQGSAGSASGIAGAQTIQSAGGTVPVIIGEFGNSTTGDAIDPNGDQVIKAVANSGKGFLAWAWDPDPTGDRLTNGSGALTGYGQTIASAISAVGPSPTCNTSPVASLVPSNQLISNPANPASSAAPMTPINSLSSIAAPGG